MGLQLPLPTLKSDLVRGGSCLHLFQSGALYAPERPWVSPIFLPGIQSLFQAVTYISTMASLTQIYMFMGLNTFHYLASCEIV